MEAGQGFIKNLKENIVKKQLEEEKKLEKNLKPNKKI